MSKSKLVDKIMDMQNDVNRPSHYTQGKIEVIDFLEDQNLDFRLANVIKYICRHKYKGKPIQDIEKAIWYLERYRKRQYE